MRPIYNELAQPLLNELVELQERAAKVVAVAQTSRSSAEKHIGELETINERTRAVERELEDPRYHVAS